MWPDPPRQPPTHPIPERHCPRCDGELEPGRRLACRPCQRAAEVAIERAGTGVTVTPGMIEAARRELVD